MALKFGVRQLGESAGEGIPAVDSPIEFFCPGCGKPFRQSAHAAGRKTRCPQCETVFAIPETIPARPSPVPVQREEAKPIQAASPVEATSKEAGVAAAVAAYNAGKTRRSATPRWIIPTGLALLLLGGALSIGGSYFMVQGYMKAFALEELLGGKGADIGTILGGAFGGRDQIVQDLLGDIDNPNRRRRPNAGPPNSGIDPQKLLAKADEQQKGLNRQLAERKASREEGQSLILRGVITHGAGKLVTFIGGIFLLAGLIGRFLRPQPATE